ncbi:restriction endonuclease subunit S [Pseudomonas alliivorans]|nr:restriction endonuclease subunit S [Pseudomonas alliivorans]MEE4801043.1 restriction endonuclease subunit S [Pseudomonas alliivorans]
MFETSPFPTAQLADVVEILDNLRVPINGAERLGRVGTVPYYGANGFQGWIDRPLFAEPLILLAEDGGNFDDFATRPIAYRIDGPAWVNNHAHIIRARDGVCQSFIFWSLVNKDIRKYIAGGTRTKLTQGELRRIEINFPDLLEQQGIAQVLDTLDTVIYETKAIIAKLTAVKQGLLHDLLTRGIDANGELRPPQTEAPDLYRKTDQGWIPLDWDVRPLSEYTSSEITYGIVQAGPHVPNGVPYIRTGDMSGDSLSREAMLCTSRRIASSYARSEVRTGDIVMAIRATVGKVLPVPSDLDGANLTQGTAKVSPNAGTDGVFLLWAIRHSRSQQAIQLQIKGTTFAEITLGALRQVPIAAPVEINEQREIGKRLAAIDMQLQSEQQYLAKTHAKKSGLMNDLLTGRVRVTPLLAEAALQKGSA